ncbi:hypothetical protein AALB39_20375 [Lachnospiraceae bacterium 54-53]
MHFSRIHKAVAGILVLSLIASAAVPAVTALADNTTEETTQPPSPPREGEAPPDGAPGQAPPSGDQGGQAPPSGNQEGQTPPSGGQEGQAPPSGDQEGQTPPSEGQEGQTPPEAPAGGMGGADTMTYDYKGTYTAALTADGTEVTSEGETFTASETDQNAALAQNAGILKIIKGILNKSGDDTNGDNCNFYGVNSILLAVNEGSAAYISDSSFHADSEGSNGIFSTDNAVVYSNNNTIETSAGNSRGLDATYGGTIIANLMDISTKGEHSASIATDRGGGSISVTNSSLSTAGSGSPLLYSTGNIEVDNVTGTASGSQIAGMEGLNTIRIYNSKLTSTNTGSSGSDPVPNGIIIYQSTSGDAESATGNTATFEASGSTLKSAVKTGAMFYSTNTEANIVLKDTVLDFDSANVNLMTIAGNDSNGWGTAGSNGSQVKFTGIGETLSGNIDVDTISSLSFFLLKNTTYTGAAAISTNPVNTDASEAPITMNVDSTSKWVVTGDSTVTNLNAESGSVIEDEDGRTVTVIANGKTVVTGTSAFTVTVTGGYSETVTTDSSNELSTSYLDRTDFDEYYGTSTAFGQNQAEPEEVTETEAETQPETGEAARPDEETQKNGNGALFAAVAAICLAIGGGVLVSYRKKRK